MKALVEWLEHRTGCGRLLHEALFENVPGGSRWRYVWGSTLSFTLSVQFITGIFLWMAYSPSSQTAWESVYYIQHEMIGGWLLRGLHHYTAQAMNVLLVLHLMQVVIDGAYKAPREVNFWFGLGLLGLVMGLSLTGYLLPWDQKGYWATKVATSIAAITPFVGPQIQKLIVGGAEYGHHTLTRFFALHAGVLPGMIVALLVAHIYLFRRHGLTAKEPRRRPDEPFWPDQVLKDAVACLAVLAAVLVLVWRYGAELGAPADPAENYAAARPEWYFLFLFQLLKYFPGEREIFGAMIIPGLIMGLLVLMPFIGRKKLGHRFNLGLLWGLLLAGAILTWQAIKEDRSNPTYVAAVRGAQQDAERVVELARAPAGIPPAGAVTLLRNDAFTQGPKLFARNCASCHRYAGHDGTGNLPTKVYRVQTNETPAQVAQAFGMNEATLVARNGLQSGLLTNGQPLEVYAPASASDLANFASRGWLAGFLDPERIAGSNYFGGTKLREGKMVKFVKKDVASFHPGQQEQLRKALMALSAEAGLKAQRETDQRDAAAITEGRALLGSTDMRCTECHQFHKTDEDASAPDLTGYGSRDWLLSFVNKPNHDRFYGKLNDRMPAFGADQILDEKSMRLIVDWLRGDWYEAHSLKR